MDFSKVLHLSQPVEDFQQIRLTRAQVEMMVEAGQCAPIAQEFKNAFHISVIRSERVMADEDLKKKMPSYALQEIQTGGPVFFIISVKNGQLKNELTYLYTGMIMANMQLQATAELLGYAFSSKPEKVNLFHTPEWKNKLSIPREFTPIQILKVGYSVEAVNERTPFLSEVLSRIVD